MNQNSGALNSSGIFMEKLSWVWSMDPVTDADRDPMTVTPKRDAPTYYGTSADDGRLVPCRGDACRPWRRRGQGIGRRSRNCRKDEGGNHNNAEQKVGKFGRFHKNDPPLIVEIILDLQSNRLMTRL